MEGTDDGGTDGWRGQMMEGQMDGGEGMDDGWDRMDGGEGMDDGGTDGWRGQMMDGGMEGTDDGQMMDGWRGGDG